jgi:hypothetical protein
MERHFKADHTLPAAISNVDNQATPAERQAASVGERTRNQRYRPYAPPPAGPKETEGEEDTILPEESMDVELDEEAQAEDPIQEITSQMSRITPYCECHKCSDC